MARFTLNLKIISLLKIKGHSTSSSIIQCISLNVSHNPFQKNDQVKLSEQLYLSKELPSHGPQMVKHQS